MELIRESTACFTGHRYIAAEHRAAVRDAAERAARQLIMQGYDTFLCGGALGFDTLAQLAVMRVRDELPFLRVIMAIPCAGQDERWLPDDRRIYRRLTEQADECIVLSPAYSDGCMLVRNRFMVDHSSACIAFWNGTQMGGTAYTVRYARERGIKLRNIAESVF